MDNQHTIREIFGHRKYVGDVGVEIEIEGQRRFPIVGDYWKSEEDGSLRGHSMEYVLSAPSKILDLPKKLNYLKEQIEEAGSKPKFSERAGVHIHVNCQEMKPSQCVTLAMIYYCLENALVRYCGEGREGNHFCLRLEDADYVVDVLESALKDDNLRYLDCEDIRYASLNWNSLFKYGSLEFRAMETQPDFSKILEWAQILVKLRDYAKDINYEEIPFQISAHGPTGWARQILGDGLFNLINYPDFDRSVMRCMRPIQHLFYMRKG